LDNHPPVAHGNSLGRPTTTGIEKWSGRLVWAAVAVVTAIGIYAAIGIIVEVLK
jgi:hypothetical protein